MNGAATLTSATEFDAYDTVRRKDNSAPPTAGARANELLARLFSLVGSGQAQSRTIGARSAAPEEALDGFDQLNRRRLDLIERKYAGGLTPKLEEELEDLQRRVDDHISIVAPLPWRELERLEARLKVASSSNKRAPLP